MQVAKLPGQICEVMKYVHTYLAAKVIMANCTRKLRLVGKRSFALLLRHSKMFYKLAVAD